ncbi:hypothetical protein [Streptomyces cyaneofuscatus]
MTVAPPSAPYFQPGPATIRAFLSAQSNRNFGASVTSPVTL